MTPERTALLAQMRALPEFPFMRQVVQSPWDAVANIRSLHPEVRDLALQLLANCDRPDAVRTLTIAAPPGYGKTHLLAWIRHACERQTAQGLFVYVTPYLFNAAITFDQHLVRAVVQGIYLRSRIQQRRFTAPVQAFLRQLIPSDANDALTDPLREALAMPGFLEQAFRRFESQRPLAADGVRLHRHTFTALLLLMFGDTTTAWHARRWLEGEAVPPIPLHTFPPPLHTSDDIRDALYTISTLAAYPICLAFDQMEDTANSLPTTSNQGWANLTTTLRMLFTLPRYCSLFLFQLSVWPHFAKQAPPMLVDRMIEGYGVRELAPLDDRVAQDLIAERMKVHVWNRLPHIRPPDPLFPFTAERIRQLRLNSGGEVRGFLRSAHDEYTRILNGEPAPVLVAPPRLRLIEALPTKDFHQDPPHILIRAEALPANVTVHFDSQPAVAVICKPREGLIDATLPPGLSGTVLVTVRDTLDTTNEGTMTLNVTALNVPRPFGKHIDRQKLKTRREELGLTLQQVADEVGYSAGTISHLETGRTKKPADELFEKLAMVYQRPLRDFIKQKR